MNRPADRRPTSAFSKRRWFKSVRGWALALLFLAGLALPGSRVSAQPVGSASLVRAMAATMATAVPAADDGLSPAFVPVEAGLILTVRPAAILAEPALAPVSQAIHGQQEGIARELGVPLDHIEQATFAFFELSPRSRPTITLRVKEPGDALGVIKRYFNDSVEAQRGTRKYRKAADGRAGCLLLSPGSRIVVVAENETILKALLDANDAGPKAPPQSHEWKEISENHAAVLLQVAILRPFLDGGMGRPQIFGAAEMAVSPLWRNSTSIALGLTVEKRLRLSARLTSPGAGDAKRVADTLSAIRTLGGNITAELQKQQAAPDPISRQIIEELHPFFEGLSIERKEAEVTLAGSVGTEAVAGLLAMVVPQMVRDLARARTMQSQNNLKQIGLALHNYHDVHGRFPPAVLYGPSNNGQSKHGHSWRVAILPFADQAPLYNLYKFDEPWDSPDNKKVLERMPPVFREPTDPPGSTSSSYFGLVGAGTMFGDKAGIRLAAVTDGLSNTLMVVEAKRDIPWTKPEDIPYLADKPIPQLGGHHDGGFLAAFGDGAVRMVSHRIAEQVLRNLITGNDGNVVGEIPEP